MSDPMQRQSVVEKEFFCSIPRLCWQGEPRDLAKPGLAKWNASSSLFWTCRAVLCCAVQGCNDTKLHSEVNCPGGKEMASL